MLTIVAPARSFLPDASKRLGNSLDYATTLRVVERVALPDLADWCAVDLLNASGSIERVGVADVDPVREAAFRELALQNTPQITALDGVPMTLRNRVAQVIDCTATVPASSHEELLRELGMVSGLILPLVARGRTLGALTLASTRPADEIDLDVAMDLAERCAVAIDNARLYREALAAVEMRDTFLATISHDLKNPLSTINGQAQLLRHLAARNAELPVGRVDEAMKRVELTVNRMARMIDGLLDVTRIVLGNRLELERGTVDLVDVARSLAAEHQQRSARHIIQVAGETELVGTWDLGRLERVLDNLLGNAMKYSPNGGIVTIVCAREEDDAGNWAILSVRDHGVGIPAEDQPRVFERFRRASNVGDISGTGVGLSTVRDIVELHGGTITLESEPDQGTTFTIRLPLSC